MPDDPERLARIALEVATQAGALVQGAWRSRPAATKKARVDLVTEWDLQSERLIRRLLAERTPGIPVYAEEEGGARRAGPTWCCDPLDGTTNFVHGHPFWAVSIGLVDAGHALAGAVVAPSLGTTWCGAAGQIPDVQ